ncbi:bifunctional cobalt-precorrin-7 (C(5))-methyltransferase/cobalt-precorrin-6B (C(15))-methyltransferase [Thermostaphylospora chromogena]|uniref:Precorrin-6Y C5,15-methyltransferase (Decarboxylating) n=1 Tax=Thermostaphylospora chromogena TaxID=35622 RepID=A0A1H1I6M9_9ACTN|nr:bifunctional cobalt-precorrin-7 (C(5))-methyltransferase CbiE/decarboxylating cobalt-precorrin-6B (C(15))-methyltransferase CbiT [Thermostaphylospora chromogena]SDR33377.1 precorrin-6Y C5,15-methyltransferase (decarboxylating) [Thermostaphylospora chromogena]
MITVIGYDGSEPSPAARARLKAATLVTGPERLLRRLHPAESGVPPAAAADPLAAAEAHLAAGRGPAVVLADGDPGFFGAVRALRERGITPEVLPAVPAVSRAFGRAAIPWEDALVVATDDCRRAANVCRAHHKVAVLVRPGVGPAELARELAPTTPRTLIVVEDLGGPEERVTHSRMGEATTRPWKNPDVVLVVDPRHRAVRTPWLAGARPGPGEWALTFDPPPPAPVRPVTDVALGKAVDVPAAGVLADPSPPGEGARAAAPSDDAETAPRTSPSGGRNGQGDGDAAEEAGLPASPGPEVRAFVLAKLGPRLGDMVWDVGAGHGEIAVECARFGAAVVAVERDPDRCEVIRRNVIAHGVKVALARGQAPPALEPLPDPDAVFVAGGGPDVLAACAARSPASLVCTLRTVERVPAALAVLREHGYHAEGTQIRADRLAVRPDGTHHLTPAAPVFVVHATRP